MRAAVSRYSFVSGVFAASFYIKHFGCTARKIGTQTCLFALCLALPVKIRSVAISIDVKSKVVEHIV